MFCNTWDADVDMFFWWQGGTLIAVGLGVAAAGFAGKIQGDMNLALMTLYTYIVPLWSVFAIRLLKFLLCFYFYIHFNSKRRFFLCYTFVRKWLMEVYDPQVAMHSSSGNLLDKCFLKLSRRCPQQWVVSQTTIHLMWCSYVVLFF